MSTVSEDIEVRCSRNNVFILLRTPPHQVRSKSNKLLKHKLTHSHVSYKEKSLRLAPMHQGSQQFPRCQTHSLHFLKMSTSRTVIIFPSIWYMALSGLIVNFASWLKPPCFVLGQRPQWAWVHCTATAHMESFTSNHLIAMFPMSPAKIRTLITFEPWGDNLTFHSDVAPSMR